jgi:LmbE family N-acetylglucosaminyl deacetylase
MKVLLIAAHPDDELLGAGGTIRKHHLDGDDIRVVLACEGVSMRYDAEHGEALHAQTLAACSILGVTDVRFLGLPDQRLDTLPLVDVITPVEAEIDDFEPEIVYTHFGGDVNHDHRILFEAVQVATRPYAAPSVKQLLCFATPSATEWGYHGIQGSFTPDLMVNITNTLDAKIEAFLCYEKELRAAPHPRSPESLRAIAVGWGSVIGAGAAEPFQVIRILR